MKVMKNTTSKKLNKELIIVFAVIASLMSATLTGCGSNTSAATKSSSTGLVASKTVGGGNKSTHGDKLASETAWSIKEDSWEPGDDTEALSAESVRSESDQENDCPYVEDSWEPGDDDSDSTESVTAESKPSTPCSEYVDPSMYPGNQMSDEEVESIVNQYLDGYEFDGISLARSLGFDYEEYEEEDETGWYCSDLIFTKGAWRVTPMMGIVTVKNEDRIHGMEHENLDFDHPVDLNYTINDTNCQQILVGLKALVRVFYNINFIEDNGIENGDPTVGNPEYLAS